MPGKHKTPLAEWVRAEAQRRGVTVTTILNEAIQAAKARSEAYTGDAVSLVPPGGTA